MTVLGSGNVGIGTTNPSQKLEVAGTVKATAFDGAMNTSGNIASSGNLQISGSGPHYFSTGNVGIGTTSPATNAGYTTLQVNNDTTGGILRLSNGATNRGIIVYDSNGVGFGTEGTATPLRWKAGTISGATDSHMFLNTSGNLGIGTTAPAQQVGTGTAFQVSGGENGSEPAVVIGNVSNQTAGNRGRIDFMGTSNNGNPKIAASVIGKIESSGVNTVAGALAFETINGSGPGGTERMRIDSAGNVGIGTTSPSQKLDVAGNIALTSAGDLIAHAGNIVSPFGGLGLYENLWSSSEDINTVNGLFGAWVNPTVTDNNIAGPNGEVTAAKIARSHASASMGGLVISATASLTYTGSVWLKAGTETIADICISTGNSGALVGNCVGRTSITLTSNWQRYTVSGTMPASGANQIELGIGFQAGTVGDYYYAWGVQIEQRSAASSYAYTNGTAVSSGDGLFINSAGPHIIARGNAIIGHTAALTFDNSMIPALQVTGDTLSNSGQSWTRFSADAGGPQVRFSKSRGASIGTNTVVQADDELGIIRFNGADGSGNYDASGAMIAALVDGTPGNSDMPGRLVFYTTADGGTISDERMRINSSGVITLGVAPATGGYGDAMIANVSGAKVLGSGIPTGQFAVIDTTAVATGVGGAIAFGGKYAAANSSTIFAAIQGYKSNATDGNYAGELRMGTRANGGDITYWMVMNTSGIVSLSTDTASTSSTTGALVVTGGVGVGDDV
ncbi:MAG: hypothetical protein Q7N50_12740, partial [Armatimonadota bacterium]|nr:hypothetical protein [Armatimonadota bacterium]